MAHRWTGSKSSSSLRRARRQRLFVLAGRVILSFLALFAGRLVCHWRRKVFNHCTHLLAYDPSYGGWNNQLLALFVGLHLAQRLGRRLVMPYQLERGQAQLAWTELLDIEPALRRRWTLSTTKPARCQHQMTASRAFDRRNISLRLYRDAVCAETIAALEAASAQAGPRLLQIANPYGLVRCFTRQDESFLRLWQRVQLRPTRFATHWLQQWRAFESARTRPLVVVVHVRSSGFEARAHARRPHAFPASALTTWMLAGNESVCMHPDQRAALCQICAILQRDPDKRPVYFYLMHDKRAESLQVLTRWKAFVEDFGMCGAADSRVYDLTTMVQGSELYGRRNEGALHDVHCLVTEMYLAVYGAHLFVGSTLSTLSSNVARWRSLARYPVAPSLSYTGDFYLSAIPHVLGFH